MPEINGISIPFLPAGGIGELKKPGIVAGGSSSNISFDDIFKEELGKLKFSGHAQTRMKSREINLSGEDMARLQNAVDRAGQKGANDALILLNDKGFIVNIPNKTVVTALFGEQLETGVVTNIDSAVLA